MIEQDAIETKSDGGATSAPAFDEFMRAFEAFKETNDRRLGEIERRGAADAVTTDKLERIDRALMRPSVVDDLAVKARAAADRRRRCVARGAALQHKAAFEGYVRSGETAQPARSRGQGAVGRLRSRRRLSGAGRDRARR